MTGGPAALAPALPSLLAVEPASAPVTNWGLRLALTAAMFALVAGWFLAMRRGWVRRQARQSGVPAPAPRPGAFGPELVQPADGTYVSTTTAGDWLDRIAVHGLGNRSAAVLHVAPQGVWLERTGEGDVFVGADALVGVDRTSGMAGKFVGGDGLVVLTWLLGEHVVDTGFRAREHVRTDELVAAVAELLRTGSRQ